MKIEIIPRITTNRRLTLAATLAAVALALLLGAVLLLGLGVDPLAAYAAIFSSSMFGGAFALSDTAVKATPLLLCGLGCALAFRARLWNVGAEGQLLLGAWASVGVAMLPLPSWLLLPSMALASVLAGGAWAGLSGFLRARLGVSEIISSLMLVYVAQQLIKYFVFGPWSEGGFPLTPLLPEAARLPRLSDWSASVPAFAGLTVHAGFVVGLLCCAALLVLLTRTAVGFELRLLGDNPEAARTIGLHVERGMFVAMAASGALAGLAGLCEVAGVVFRLQDRFSPGYGFVAIAVAWLGRLHPVGVLLAAWLFGALLVGAKELQPAGIAQMLQGVLMLVAVAGDVLLRYRFRLRPSLSSAPERTSDAGAP